MEIEGLRPLVANCYEVASWASVLNLARLTDQSDLNPAVFGSTIFSVVASNWASLAIAADIHTSIA